MDFKTQLLPIFEILKDSSHRGVPGVLQITHDLPGPTVCISVGTHGNEPSGLYGVQELLNLLQKRRCTVQGTLFLILNNINATELYLKDEEKVSPEHFRYIDTNMNRLPGDVFTRKTESYEELRAQELRPVWEEVGYALDIHSTTLPTEPFIVNPQNVLQSAIVAGLPVHKVITNTDAHASGFPAIHFYGTGSKPAHTIGIECGSHEDPQTFKIAYQSIVSFLAHAGSIKDVTIPKSQAYEIYEIYRSVYAPDETYRLTKAFGNFERLAKGTILMEGSGDPVMLAEDSHSFFVAPQSRYDPAEEVMFLSKLAKEIKL